VAVLSSKFKPVYAKQNSPAPRLRALFVVFPLFLFILFSAAPLLWSSSLEDAPHDLAMKVCTAGRRQAVNVHWQESGNSAGYWSDARKKAFLEQISACGIEPSDAADAPVLQVSAQATPSSLLLVAEASDGAEGRQIRMIEVPRDLPLRSGETAAGPHLNSELLWQQEQPISSAVEWQDPASHEDLLFLLSDGKLVRLQNANGAWSVEDSVELPPARKHGRVSEGSFAYHYTDHLNFLRDTRDGNICSFSPNGPLAIKCTSTNLMGYPMVLSSKCEDHPRYLTTGNGDYTQPDQILLGSLARDPAALPPKESSSSAIDLPGPVLGISLAENNAAAFAVVRNLSTGDYEVYRITAVCSN
jgi:hypothetical protein